MNAAFQPGLARVRTAFVLAAPGLEEEQQGHPAAGATGQNLDRILAHLHTHESTEFPSTDRFDYRITNSVSQIMSGSASMPDWIDVVGDSNLERLHSQIHEHEVIVALSKPALIAVRL
ncbi:MAG TPA: uracil-DNA glycosylase family protein, partial [Devosia sp.]